MCLKEMCNAVLVRVCTDENFLVQGSEKEHTQKLFTPRMHLQRCICTPLLGTPDISNYCCHRQIISLRATFEHTCQAQEEKAKGKNNNHLTLVVSQAGANGNAI